MRFNDAFGTGGTLRTPENTQIYINIQKFVTYLDEKGQNRSSTTQTVDQVSAGLNASFDQLTMTLQRSGGVANQVDNAKTAMSAFGVQLADTQSVLLDTDMAAATASYTRAQTLLNAAQAMFARLQQSNLFSKL